MFRSHFHVMIHRVNSDCPGQALVHSNFKESWALFNFNFILIDFNLSFVIFKTLFHVSNVIIRHFSRLGKFTRPAGLQFKKQRTPNVFKVFFENSKKRDNEHFIMIEPRNAMLFWSKTQHKVLLKTENNSRFLEPTNQGFCLN